MKFNKILSSALVFVMLFASLVGVFPISAFAAEGKNVSVDLSALSNAVLTSDQVKNVIIGGQVIDKDGSERDEIGYINYNYASAEDMLRDELAKGYLVSASAGDYTLYVNYYTGFVYYKNNVTGQILTSNPIDPAYKNTTDDSKLALMSQIELVFSEKANASKETNYNSLKWIRDGAILEVTEAEDGGISLKYTLGDISEYYVTPGAMLSEDFKNELCKPIFDNFAALLETHLGPFDPAIAQSAGTRMKLESYHVDDPKHNIIYPEGNPSAGEYRIDYINRYLSSFVTYAEKALAAKGLGKDSKQYLAISGFYADVSTIFVTGGFSLIDASNRDFIAENIKNEVAAIGEGKAVYKIGSSDNVDTLRMIDKAIRTGTNGKYTTEHRDLHEQNCGYNPKTLKTPCINVTVRYLLDEDGILTVDIPTDTEHLKFQADTFEITSLTPLKYFGVGDMDNDGYIFYPDGSGTIVEFSDFYYGSTSDKVNTSIYVESPVYGRDYVYSTITGAHREQITMPVYGLVNDVKLGAKADGYKNVTNGYFTIIESGASTASLCFESGGGTHKYATAYSIIRPYPSDKYDLSQSLSVSGLGFYYVVAERGFEGSYKYRVNMLTDENNAGAYKASEHYYPSDYAGMAACYRDYLEARGDITALKEFSEDLPLYIEALGSMDIVERILTFPVTVSTSLTTFEQVEKIYGELSDVAAAKEKFKEKAKDYREKAKEVEDNNSVLNDDDHALIATYQNKADHYDALAEKIENIYNVNFRLTGFANGGMYFTYPAKVKWEKSVGGKRGFNNLLAAAEEVNKKEGYNLGIFPDFDFLFINNTAAFDGVSNRSAARMVDNRYASKQSYNSILQRYESLFALVLSTDSLDKLYTKFEKKYSKFDIDSMSVSTLGSTLNSNFDEDNIVNRETALGHVSALLDKMANKDNYSLMTDKGNIYSVRYVDHILNASIDSSHFRYSSFTVPFYGMVLHGYVNYAGSALNYAGSPDYDILRSIENGASLYYILCYENTNHLKEDELLSKYYGIDYANWYENILENYLTVKNAIGDLQKYNIIDHDSLIAERIIDEDEMYSNYNRLVDEYIDNLRPAVEAKINEAVAANPDNRGMYKLNIDRASVKSRVDILLETCDNETVKNSIIEKAYKEIDEKIDLIESGYKNGQVVVDVVGEDIVYDSQYSYVTDSIANAEDYEYTEFTSDNGSVVMVVYKDPDTGNEVIFLLNYNNFSVELNVDNTIDSKLSDGETKKYTLGAYGCYKLTATESIEIK